jgi:S-DNA-T family DNA segregation ATPase FtsK/SpoIIIE
VSKNDTKDDPAPRKRATRFVPLEDVPRPGLSQRTREVLALALCGFALYGMLCLATFRLPMLDAPVPTDGMSNLGGVFGYYLALGFTRALGFAGWIPFVMLLFGAMWLFLGRTLERVTIKLLGTVVFAAMLAILLAGGDGLAGISAATPYGAGGVFGRFVSPRLEGTFGGTGRLLLVSFGALMALMIATEWLLSQLFLRLALVVDLGWRRLWRRPATAGAELGGDAFETPEPARRRRRAAKTGDDEDEAVDEAGEAAGGRRRGRAAAGEAAVGADEAMAAEDGDATAATGRRRTKRKGTEQPVAVGDEAEVAESEAEAEAESDAEAEGDGDDDATAGEPEAGERKSTRRRRGKRGAESAEDHDGLEAGAAGEAEDAEVEAEEPQPPAPVVAITPPPPPPRPIVVLKPKPKPKPKPKKSGQSQLPFEGYPFPPIELFQEPQHSDATETSDVLTRGGQAIVSKLDKFGIAAEVVAASVGPAVTQYELRLDEGTRVNKIAGFEADLAAALKAVSVRVVAPIPGKDTIGIEVPNSSRQKVFMRDLLDTYGRSEELAIPLYLGKDVAGNSIVEDLAKMPHLLIAGTTGSGKSVCINTILLSILMTRTPEQVKLILVDPKMVELQAYKRVPHLCCDVVTNMKKAPGVLQWAVDEMENRYALLSAVGVNHIRNYNRLGQQELEKRLKREPDPERVQLPYVVIVIDEFADLMNVAQNEVEELIQRLAQKSRAVGMHVILATQRPSSEVITGIIKANLPCQIAFKVNRRIDSRVILDANGAEKLLGHGDMLYMPPGGAALLRAQGTFVADDELQAVVKFLEENGQEPSFTPSLVQTQSSSRPAIADRDERYREAVEIILGQQRGSATLLQRALAVGYTRATRLLELMEEDGLVGAFVGSKSRDVLMTLEEYRAREEAREAMEAEAGEGGEGEAGGGDGEDTDGGEDAAAAAVGADDEEPPFAVDGDGEGGEPAARSEE